MFINYVKNVARINVMRKTWIVKVTRYLYILEEKLLKKWLKKIMIK